MAGPPFLARGRAALADALAGTTDAEPLRAAMVRSGRGAADAGEAAHRLVAWWRTRTPGSIKSDARYRWELTHRIGVPMPAYAGAPSTWRGWHRREQPRVESDPFEVELRLLLPVVLAENLELLLELGEDAEDLLAEAAPLLRRDFARHAMMNDAWEDTFALWCLTRYPRTRAFLHPIAVAIAACWAATADVPVLGVRFPYHGHPLTSASAHLAAGLSTLGMDLSRVAALATWLRGVRHPSGGWSDDAEDEADGDPLTTLVVADALSALDPTFDLAPTLSFFAKVQHEDGFFRALGPDAPWLTREVLAFAERASRPFPARFRWPHRTPGALDHKTGLPSFAYFVDVARMFAELPGLAGAQTELVFIDLIGFRAFNNRFGQDAGDHVLAELAVVLEEFAARTHACAIRDGGDEFLVVGAPSGERAVAKAMDDFRLAWPARFRARFGADVPPVAPRMLVATARGAQLRAAREELGRGITTLKNDASAHPTEGLLRDVGEVRTDAPLSSRRAT